MIHALRRILDEIKAETNFENALHRLVDLLKKALVADVASAYILDDSQQHYILKASDGLNPLAIGKVRLAVNQGLVGFVGEREEPLNLAHAASHPKFHFLEQTGEAAYNSFLSAPLINRKKVIGVLVVQRKRVGKFSAADERFIMTLSTQLASVLASLSARHNIAFKSSPESHQQNRFVGTKVAAGLAIGRACVFQRQLSFNNVEEKRIQNLKAEIKSFESACIGLQKDLNALKREVCNQLESKDLALFDVYINMLEDDAFVGEVYKGIQDGFWAASSLKKVVLNTIQSFQSIDDDYLKARASDIEDLGLKLLERLLQKESQIKPAEDAVILIGENISATTLLEWPRAKLAGVISLRGTSNSHMAIIARAIELPAIVGIHDLPLNSLQGESVILDGFKGEVIVNPSQELQDLYENLLKQELKVSKEVDAEFDLPARTACGQNIQILANTGFLADAKLALRRGAGGVGLLRTEISFMSFDSFPSEEEQITIYKQHLRCFTPKKVCMRTLDIGGDKSLPYFPIKEDNPFLGWRGVRVTLDHPEILMVQVRAMLKASVGLNNLQILLPMVTYVEEVDEALRLIHRAYQEVHEEGFKVVMPKIGVMIEVPAALIMARAFADRVDFISVGTNDLVQYLLAVDRNNPKVAHLYHAFHPVVINALSHLVKQLEFFSIELCVCGEIAGDAAFAALLIGMGYRTLSMNASSILRVKWVLRRLSISDMEELVDIAKKCETADECRDSVMFYIQKFGVDEAVHQSIKQA